MIIAGFVFWFYFYGLSSFSDFFNLKSSFFDKLIGGVYFFSIAGLPPFSGVFLKLIGIIVLFDNFPVVLFFLVLSSAVRLYYYVKAFTVLILRVVDGFNFSYYGEVSRLKLLVVRFVLNCFLGFGVILRFSYF